MIFSSIIFLFCFLPIVLFGYFLIRREFRNLFLLIASLVFYAWGEKAFVLVMLVSTIANYCFALLIEKAQAKERGHSRSIFIAAVVFNLGLLALFKYAGFVVNSLNPLFDWIGLGRVDVSLHLPIGISFFTFHALSYLTDIYRKEVPAQRGPINTALYISLFPQLVAGPIIRYHDIAGQLSIRSVNVEKFSSGVRRFLIGLGKKVLIANTVGVAADRVFALSANDLTFWSAWLGVSCYTIQIYFDFSAYSDMAIGLGKMFGFEFRENFNYPYISRSIKEFWRRWHISLSTWFRDYLYYPLGGNRLSPGRTYINLLIVFFLCGLWHGASWNFVLWGLFHGTFLVFERRRFGAFLESLWSPVRYLYTLLVVMVGWVFFRAETLSYALSYLKALCGCAGTTGVLHPVGMFLTPDVVLALTAGIIGSMPVGPWLTARKDRAILRLRAFARPLSAGFSFLEIVYFGVLFLISAALLAGGTYNPFIYFRF